MLGLTSISGAPISTSFFNPNVTVNVTGNMNPIWSFQPQNNNFDMLMKNFEIFKKYCHDNNREICIMVNPMRNNWGEMVHFAVWCDNHNVNLWFNTILYPAHLALFNLPSKELTRIIKQLKKDLENAYLINFNSFLSKNFDKVNHLINNQIENWLWENLENGK